MGYGDINAQRWRAPVPQGPEGNACGPPIQTYCELPSFDPQLARLHLPDLVMCSPRVSTPFQIGSEVLWLYS